MVPAGGNLVEMNYKAIGFDYGGVLNGATAQAFNARAIEVLGVSEEELMAAYFRHNKKVNKDEVTWPELWELVLAELGKTDKLSAVLALNDSRGGDALNQDVIALAKDLKQQGYAVGILSNNQAVALDRMTAQHLDDIFEVIHISAVTGLVKPEPAAFIKLAEDLKVDVGEMIFIDDSEKSLSTAAEVGYAPILYRDCEQLKRKLVELGVHA